MPSKLSLELLSHVPSVPPGHWPRPLGDFDSMSSGLEKAVGCAVMDADRGHLLADWRWDVVSETFRFGIDRVSKLDTGGVLTVRLAMSFDPRKAWADELERIERETRDHATKLAEKFPP